MHVRQVQHLLENGSYGPAVGATLSSLLGEAAILVGWLSFDAGCHEVASRNYADAISAAGAADDELVAAHAYANLTMLLLAAEQPQRAVQAAGAGIRAANAKGGPRLRSLLLSRQAQGQAALSDRGAAHDCLERAERAFGSTRGHDASWTAFFTDAELAGAAGVTFRRLGDRRASVKYLGRAADLSQPARNRSSWALQHASSLIAIDEPAQAATRAAALLPAVRDMSSTRIRRQVGRLVVDLAPHDAVPEVRELRERLAALGLAS